MDGRREIFSPGGGSREWLSQYFWPGVLFLVGSYCGTIAALKSQVSYRRFTFYHSEEFQSSVVYKTKTAGQCIDKCGSMPCCFGVEFYSNSGDCRISEMAIANITKYNNDVTTMVPRVLPIPNTAIPDSRTSSLTHILIIGGNPDKRAIWEYIPETKNLTKSELRLPNDFSTFHHATYTSENSLYIMMEDKSPTPIMLLKANPLTIENANVATPLSDWSPRCGVISADGKFYHSLSLRKLHSYDTENNYAHSEKSNSDIPNMSFACYFDGDRVFIFGGWSSTFSGKVSEIGLTSGLTVYSGNLPESYAYHESVWFQNGVVLCGNYDSKNKCDKFVISDKSWVYFPDLNYGRTYIGLVKWDDKLLAFGGKDDSTQIMEVSDGVTWEVFDSKTQFAGMNKFEAVNIGKF